MANWDFIFAYDKRATDWLEEQGFAHPPVRAENRLPSFGEVSIAIEDVLDDEEQHEVIVDGFSSEDFDSLPDDSFKMRGNQRIMFKLLKRLALDCGQFWCYPDTGEVAVVIDKDSNIDFLTRLAEEANARDDSWEHFHDCAY